MQHLLLRMPSAYLYYLECFPGTVPFFGSDWLGSLTGHGVDPATPFVIARYMYPDAIAGAAMAAPAHVQAYAEGGVLNALFAVGAVAVIVALAGKLYRRSREGAVMHAAYIQALVALYYLTQTSFRGAIWHSYGYVWSAGALAALAVVSWRPSPSMATLRVKPVMMTPRAAARVS
jgi:heme/copper-type cytochrome/quinol oxidase subunit 4